MKKTFVIFLILLAIFVVVNLAISFVFPTFNLIIFITNIPIHLQDILTGLSQVSLQAWAAIGSAGMFVSAVIGKLWSKLTQAKQQVQEAETLASNTEASAVEQIQDLNQTIKTQKATIDAQAEKIQTLEANPQELVEAQKIVTQQAELLKTQTAELNALKQTGNMDYVRLLQEALRKNKIPVPSPETKTVTIVR